MIFFTVAVNAQWVQTNGPNGGTVNCFAISDTNIYAGTNGGVFLSTNNGTSWTAINTGLTNIMSMLLLSAQQRQTGRISLQELIVAAFFFQLTTEQAGQQLIMVWRTLFNTLALLTVRIYLQE